MNDVNGATFTSGTSSGRGADIQRNPYGVRVLGRGARSKNKRQSSPASPSGSSTNKPATCLERRMKAAQSIRTRDNVEHSPVNHHQLLLGNWNILTLTGKELELVEEAKRSISILSEFLQPNDVALELLIWMADGNSSILVLILVCLHKRVWGFSQAPVCQTVCQIGFLWNHGSGLKVLDRSLCLLQVYAPNATSEYQTFVDEVNDALLRVSATESTVLMGDFNAHVGTDTDTWKGVIGKHGVTGLNENGRYLLQLCCSNGLRIMNTFFQHREVHKYTWYRPSMDQKSLIDFCIVSSDLFSDVLDVRVKRGAELSTDHHLVVCSLRLSKPWPNKRSNRSSVTYRIKCEALEDKEVRKQFASSISSKFRQLPDVSEDIEKEWLLFRSAIISSAAESCGRKRLRMAGDSEKRTPWWNQEVKEAIRAKKDAFKAWLQDR